MLVHRPFQILNIAASAFGVSLDQADVHTGLSGYLSHAILLPDLGAELS